MTKTRFLHIEDSLVQKKLRFFVGSFERGQGMNATAYAFLDLEDARVVLSDMSWGKVVDFADFKGGKDNNNAVISRVLKIRTREDKVSRTPDSGTVWIDVQNGPGQEFGEGSFVEGRFPVKPLGKPFADISIPFTIFEGRKLAHACLAYIHAWEVAMLLKHLVHR